MNNRVKFLILIISIALIWYLGKYFPIDASAIQGSLKKLPLFYSGIIFVILYCIVTFFIWLSKDYFKFIAAVLFGPYLSTLFIWISEIINATILFYIARLLGRDFVENSLRGRYNKLDEGLGNLSFFWLFLFRAVPLIPFRFLDLSLGFTRVSFRKYLAAVILGSPLRIFWVQYILFRVGKSIFTDHAKLVEFFISNKAVFILSFIYLILVIVVALKIKTKR
jgi:uncharacterized membrane protein YdjX (TVP38/TMEM64 family)